RGRGAAARVRPRPRTGRRARDGDRACRAPGARWLPPRATVFPAPGPRMTTCSELSLALGGPLQATASFARAWVLVEEPAPWGRKAVAEAGLGQLEQRAKALGVRVGLVRRGRERSATGHRAFLVHCGPGRAFVEEAEAADAAALDDRALERLAAGGPAGPGAARPAPPLL